MKLLQIDAVPFHACVYKVMNDNNWEIRYQGLDQLYGLFTKMDAGFQSKWLPLLAKLGPVFSTLVASLWDNNENARIKATALLQSFGTLHLNSAFRCWEAHFYSASDSELRSLVHMMIRLHSLFPDWQVLQWECLLESLETKITMLASSKETHPSNSSARDTKMDPIQLAESENVTVLMMTLALQMLSHHVRIDMVQISRLKLVLVTMMGFQHPHRVLDGGEWKVLFGPIDQPFQDDKSVADPLQTSILTCCSRGLKLIMDSFAPLPAETVAKMDSKALQHNRLKLAENSSPGVHFIDVVLKYFHTDLTDLNPITLRTWLEVILIVIYKHNILDRAYEQDLVFAMKQVIDLVLHEIGEENKLLVLEILHCLLRQSDHLTAMVLSKQIVVLGKLMAQAQRKRSSDPVFLRAKQFLKAAFSRFAAAGLFVLIFKNQTITEQPQQTDLFFVLRSIIDADDKVPDEDPVVYLRDQPVRDVIDKLMKQHQMDRKSFSAVLCNMSRYVQTVHSYPYPENVLADYAGFLQLLVKYTQNWRRFDWDINPLFTMSAILLMEHPYHFQTLLPAMQVLFVHGIRHCTIQAECAVHMVASFASLENIPGIPATNIFADTIVDEIRLALTQRLKLPKDTLLTALQLVLWDSDERYHPWYISIESNYLGASVDGRHRPYFANRLDPLLDPMLSYLKSTPYTDQFTKKDFKTYNTVAHILSWKCLWSDQAMDHVLSTIHLDETRSSLRFLSWFLLCHLKQSQIDLLHRMEGLQTTLTEFLIQLFDAVQIPYGQPDPGFVYSHTGEVLVLAFLLLKIWTLVILRTTRVELLKHHQECLRNQFWISVWPSIRRLLCSIPIDTLVSGRHLDDTGSGQSQANEMVVDQFQHQVVRVRQMFNVPPIQVPMHTLVDQLYLELRQVMRLQATSNTSALDDWDASGFGTAVGNID
ncbi:hypothetical protein DM01DRAFT_317113 [Hesseltinella vesiculosa]|uniref:Uncharacterized protein n=1 Tax=Hesseltinella vesiculosa TaxID=101127 RepID=A0A1X2GCD5_9FUNG|nr:hypothetical protein DM01DRAFT_317113 [Hesseltinella vesiculosa]